MCQHYFHSIRSKNEDLQKKNERTKFNCKIEYLFFFLLIMLAKLCHYHYTIRQAELQNAHLFMQRHEYDPKNGLKHHQCNGEWNWKCAIFIFNWNLFAKVRMHFLSWRLADEEVCLLAYTQDRRVKSPTNNNNKKCWCEVKIYRISLVDVTLMNHRRTVWKLTIFVGGRQI